MGDSTSNRDALQDTASASFFRRYAALVRHVCRRSGVADGDIDDVVQRVFIIVFSKMEDIQPDSERAFVVAITRREAGHWRRSYARRAEVCAETITSPAEAAPQPDDMLHLRRRLRLAQRTLHTLDEGARQIWVLCEIEGLSCHDIAQRLELPLGTVKSRLRRAKRALQQRLEDVQRVRTSEQTCARGVFDLSRPEEGLGGGPP